VEQEEEKKLQHPPLIITVNKLPNSRRHKPRNISKTQTLHCVLGLSVTRTLLHPAL
jgi:hypothetical protein